MNINTGEIYSPSPREAAHDLANKYGVQLSDREAEELLKLDPEARIRVILRARTIHKSIEKGRARGRRLAKNTAEKARPRSGYKSRKRASR